MNKLDFYINVMVYSGFVLFGFLVILIAAAGLSFIPMWIHYIIALSVGFGLAHKKCKKEVKE